LIVAFACRPAHGSEPGVGWAVASGAARSDHDVVLITQRRHRSVIEDERSLDRGLATRLRPVYIGLPAPLMNGWDRWGGLRGLQLYNLLWQSSLYLTARKLHQKANFDLAHHVTLSTDWIPSGLAYVRGLPVVW